MGKIKRLSGWLERLRGERELRRRNTGGGLRRAIEDEKRSLVVRGG